MAVCSYSRSSISLSYLGTCGEEVHALVSCLHRKLAVTSVALFSAFPIEVGGGKKGEACEGGNILTAGARRSKKEFTLKRFLSQQAQYSHARERKYNQLNCLNCFLFK